MYDHCLFCDVNVLLYFIQLALKRSCSVFIVFYVLCIIAFLFFNIEESLTNQVLYYQYDGALSNR